MNIKKSLIIALILGIMMFILVPAVNAATPNEELYSFFKNASYTVEGKTYTATAEQLNVLTRYLNTHTVTEEQVTLVKNNTEKVVEILKEEKTADVSKLSSSAISKIDALVDEAASSLGIDSVSYNSASNSIKITYDGRTDEVPVEKTTVQTGHTYVPYMIASVAIIAVAAATLKRSVK